MKPASIPRGSSTITLVDVLAIVVVLLILAWLLLPILAMPDRSSEYAARMRCMGNLRSIALALHEDYKSGGESLWLKTAKALVESRPGFRPQVSVPDLFRSLPNQLGRPQSLACPTTLKRPAPDFAQLGPTDLRYFAGLNLPGPSIALWLAGDRTLMLGGKPLPSGFVSLSREAMPGWSKAGHKGPRGNVLFADGHAEACSAERLRQSFTNANLASLPLVLP